MVKQAFLWLSTGFLLFFIFNCSLPGKEPSELFTSTAVVTNRSDECLQCHSKKQPAIVASWQKSAHAESGVGCYECHQADMNDKDAYEHFGSIIATLVTPNDCSRCHSVEAEQFLASHHAKAGQILNSLDNYLGEVVEGPAAAVSGCRQCHGSVVALNDDNRLTADSWPNFGIGRINPDGSAGACSACHSRHDFSLDQARAPETCSRCHLGPDHPQKEVYESSKHYIAYSSHKDEMNMDSDRWVLGIDYTAAPTCATCHVSATPNQPKTHDIGLRISWNLRPEVSTRTVNWERNRKAMQEVCSNCHNPNYVDNFYVQFDQVVNLFDEKFAKPARDVLEELQKTGKIDPTPFNEDIEWEYFFLWHHEGRRARHGAAMMGPDYTQWHGFYEVAHRFYMEFIPEAEKLMPGVTESILALPEHAWFKGTMSEAERRSIAVFYSSRYGN
ncbi:MAG: multiheme c-type cytochrome [Spirochaetia bacterium]|jgi:hypothetical protein|nr:multiheme c-type cytochrome [Spirochaetia bacterium]